MKQNVIFIAAALVVLLGIAYVVIPKTASAPAATTVSTTTSQGPGYTLEQVPLPDLKSLMPNLDRSVEFSDSVPQAARDIVLKKVAASVAILKKDPTNAAEWLSLALWYHTANDYQGAKEIWEFLTKVAPNQATAFVNLGKMYHFDVKDLQKSESYFKQAIAIDPKNPEPYTELFQLYALSMKDTAKAVNIIRDAEKRFPEEVSFPFTLGAYYRDLGRNKEARTEFEHALSIARSLGKMDLVSSIGEELAKLPR